MLLWCANRDLGCEVYIGSMSVFGLICCCHLQSKEDHHTDSNYILFCRGIHGYRGFLMFSYGINALSGRLCS